MKPAALIFWTIRRWYLRLVLDRIPRTHPESWLTVSDIAACDRAIARIHRGWSA